LIDDSLRWLIAGLSLALALPAAADEADEGRLDLGREVFLERAEPGCPICHTLAEAGSSGAVGPDLDSLKPSYDRVRKAVEEGVGPMRPYDALDEAEIDALAFYVAEVTGGAAAE
jgi:cytochrome c6